MHQTFDWRINNVRNWRVSSLYMHLEKTQAPSTFHLQALGKGGFRLHKPRVLLSDGDPRARLEIWKHRNAFEPMFLALRLEQHSWLRNEKRKHMGLRHWGSHSGFTGAAQLTPGPFTNMHAGFCPSHNHGYQACLCTTFEWRSHWEMPRTHYWMGLALWMLTHISHY